MPSLEIHPLSELRDEAARLLAERFERQRSEEPLLPDVEDFAAHLPEDGLVATRGGNAVAYLGLDLERPAFGSHAANETEAIRDLFAAAAAESELTRFTVAVPASERATIDAWFRLAFGCQFVWAVRETDASSPVQVQETHVRPSTPDDLDAVAGFDEILWTHQSRSPSFSGMTVPSREHFREEWSELWNETEFPLHVVAERDGRVVGHALLYSRPEGDLRVPPQSVDLAHVATTEDVRGDGVGLMLFAHALDWAHTQGYRAMTTDWRMVNLLSSRFWPRRGFRPQYLRLYRAVP